MGLFNFFGNYDRPGPGVSKDEPPKAAPIRFFEILGRKFSKLIQLNLIFILPTIIAAVLMLCIYLAPTHFMLQLPAGDAAVHLDVWAIFATPLPLILLSPFTAGLTIVTRNYAREEHAFVWSDFWESVKNNWKYFLLNGVIAYFVYVIISFSLIYYYNRAIQSAFFYVPFWFCIILAAMFIFAQYYIPVMFVTFDLKFSHVYRNAFIFVFAGFLRNVLLTAILAALVVGIMMIPLMPITVMALLVIVVLIAFSFVSYLINFTVYPIIDQYLIQPYNKKLQEEKYGKPIETETPVVEKDPLDEKYGGLFQTVPDEDEDEESDDKYVYINGKLVKRSELKPQEKESLDE